MALIKGFQINGIEVEVYDDFVPKDVESQKKNLTALYDTQNRIADDLAAHGINTNDLFITNDRLQEIKNNEEYIFL